MEAVRVTNAKYYWTQFLIVAMMFVAISVPVNYYKYAITYSDISINTFEIFLCSLGFYLIVFVLLKGAEMPTRIAFDNSKVIVETRFFFWVSVKEYLYERINVAISKNERVLSLHYDSTIVRFDPLLWQRKQRKRIIQAFQSHHVDLS